MPSIAAAIVASLAGWLLDTIIAPVLGIAGRIFVAIIVTTYIYVYARNWLRNLRG